MSGSADGTVRLWDTADGSCQMALTVRESAVTAIACCQGKLFVAGADGNVRLFEI